MGQAGKPPAGPGLKEVGLGSSTGSGGCGVVQAQAAAEGCPAKKPGGPPPLALPSPTLGTADP